MRRLVAAAFLPNPDNLPQVNHKDGNKANNVPSNLEWCTAKENIHHSWHALKNRNQRGSYNNHAKLTEDQVAQIWHLKGKMRQRDIAALVGTNEDCVSLIHRQATWKWLTDELQ